LQQPASTICGGRREEGESTYDTSVPVYCSDPLVRTGLQQLGAHRLLDREDDAVFAPDADGGVAIFHRLDCVLDLKVSPIGRENGVG
jgi:hypothetical protein